MSENEQFILDNTAFALDKSESRFYVFDSDEHEGTLTIAVDVMCQSARYGEEMISPRLTINEHETGKASVEALAGCRYCVDNIETMTKREDTLYIYEHEPMVQYAFTIVEIAENSVHLQIEGVAVVDGYAMPHTTAPFSGNFWLSYRR